MPKMQHPYDIVGRRSIRERRRRKRMTLTTLSKLTGIAISDLSRLERRLIPVYPGWKDRIDEALGK